MADLKHHTVSFKHAFDGVLHVIRTQPNFRIHLLAAIVVISTGLYLNIARQDWLTLIFTILFVFFAEMLNTAIESVVDLITDKYHLSARIAKDVSAGMVLVTAVFAVIIGTFTLWPYF